MSAIADFVSKDTYLGGVALHPLVSTVRGSVGVLMWLISSILMRVLTRWLRADYQAAVQMLLYGRLIINQVATGLVTLWLHEDCMANWLQYFFDECKDTSAFHVSGAAFGKIVQNGSYMFYP